MTSPCESSGAHMTLESCERDDALALAEGGVGERVGDDDRPAGLEHRAHDAVGDAAPVVGDALAADVARGADRRSCSSSACGSVGRSGRAGDALVGAGELDDVVEHGLEQLVDGPCHQLLAERVELAQTLRARCDAVAERRDSVAAVGELGCDGGVGEHAERELGRSRA